MGRARQKGKASLASDRPLWVHYFCEKGSMKKILSVIVLLVVLANFLLFVFGRISNTFFWLIIVLAAIFAFWILPKLSKV